MRTELIPPTTTRVERSTDPRVNARIALDAARRVASYRDAGDDRIRARLDELEREWDIERVLETNASSLILASLALGKTVDKRWYAVPAIVAAFLLLHAVRGWCPPVPVLRRLGVRTAREIELERRALLAVLHGLA